MWSLLRVRVLALTLALPMATPAYAQFDPAHQMMPGYFASPSPVLPRYAPSTTFTAPSYVPPPVYQPSIPRYLPSDTGMAGSTFEPRVPSGYTPIPTYVSPVYRPRVQQYVPSYGLGTVGSTFDPN